jgi:hypothetical protein
MLRESAKFTASLIFHLGLEGAVSTANRLTNASQINWRRDSSRENWELGNRIEGSLGRESIVETEAATIPQLFAGLARNFVSDLRRRNLVRLAIRFASPSRRQTVMCNARKNALLDTAAASLGVA